jgi:hypothetical protein
MNGSIGPFVLTDSVDVATDAKSGLLRSEVERLCAAGFLQRAEDLNTVIVPAMIRRAPLARGRTLRSDADVTTDHIWLSQMSTHSSETHSNEIDSEIEAHHHAVEAGDFERARNTARYYGVDLRTLAFRLGRSAALHNDRTIFRRAADVYRLVTSTFDKTDAYSWEYYAFNLACFYTQPLREEVVQEVADAYTRAHALAPFNPMFHGRLIGFRAEHGQYDHKSVELALGRYRAINGARGCVFFGQAVIDGLRRAGRQDEAGEIARRWHIVPPERIRPPERTLRPRRFGSAAGTIALSDDFDEPLLDFAPCE